MTCREFERILDAIVEASAPEEVLRAAARHRDACAGCRELEEMARASLAGGEPLPTELTAAVLSFTSGPACRTAEDRMGDLVDGALAGADRELALSHLDGCPTCGALAATMARLHEELPALAAIDPGRAFTSDVMRLTVGSARAARRSRASALKARWSALLARPRFTWEAAYAGALVVWLLFGAGFAPFREVPGRALELARINAVQVIEERVQPASLGRQVWEATGRKVMARAEASAGGWSTRAGRLKEASGSLAAHGAGMIGAAFRGDLSGCAVRLKDMGADLRVLWDELRRRETVKSPKAQET